MKTVRVMFFGIVVLAACLSCVWQFGGSFTVKQEAKAETLHGAAALERLRQQGQYDSLQAAINQARFSVSRTARSPLGRTAWHAPNSVAGYDAYVTETGVSIAVNPTEYVSLSLHSLGYGDALRAVAPGIVSGDKQSIQIERPGGVREWFVNGPAGLEHGFTLSERVGARPAEVPLRLALQVSKGWQAMADAEGGSVTLQNGAGQTVEYGKLSVRDTAASGGARDKSRPAGS